MGLEGDVVALGAGTAGDFDVMVTGFFVSASGNPTSERK